MDTKSKSELQSAVLELLSDAELPLTSSAIKEQIDYEGKNLKRALDNLCTQGELTVIDECDEYLYTSKNYSGNGRPDLPSYKRLATFIKEQMLADLGTQQAFKSTFEVMKISPRPLIGMYENENILVARLNTDQSYSGFVRAWIDGLPSAGKEAYYYFPEQYVRFYRAYNKALEYLVSQGDIKPLKINKGVKDGVFPTASPVFIPVKYSAGDTWYYLLFLKEEVRDVKYKTELQFTEELRAEHRSNAEESTDI